MAWKESVRTLHKKLITYGDLRIPYLIDEMGRSLSHEPIDLVSALLGSLTATSHFDMGSGVGRTSEQSIGVAVASETLPRAAL